LFQGGNNMRRKSFGVVIWVFGVAFLLEMDVYGGQTGICKFLSICAILS